LLDSEIYNYKISCRGPNTAILTLKMPLACTSWRIKGWGTLEIDQ